MKFLVLTLIIFTNASFAAMLIPEDYEVNGKFFNVVKTQDNGRTNYRFFECMGNIEQQQCSSIFDERGYSKTELNSIETSESLKGTGLLAAEIVTGGIIWKRLMKFTLGGAVRVTRHMTGWSEGVANGSVALAVMAPTNASATVVALNTAHKVLDIIDPISRFRRSELVDTDEYEEAESGNGIVVLGYDYQEAYIILDELLTTVK
ncbi:MAG: hypothetical protein ACJAS4_002643 [Bacteriovoracaceae bacterium]|jgi:hypothetical protein